MDMIMAKVERIVITQCNLVNLPFRPLKP